MSKKSFMGGFGRAGRGEAQGNPFSRKKSEHPRADEQSMPERIERSVEERLEVQRSSDMGISEPERMSPKERAASLQEQFFNFEEDVRKEKEAKGNFDAVTTDDQFDFFNQDHTAPSSAEAATSEISLTEQFLNVGVSSPPDDDFSWGETTEPMDDRTGRYDNTYEPPYQEPSQEYVTQKVNEEARVFLRYSEETPRGNPLLASLISLFRLDVYGKNKLSKRALYAMEMASVIMIVIFCFDLSLWFVLFNLILNKGGEAFAIGVLTPFAVLLALCMATVSIIFEASIFTADLLKMDTKKWIALGSRILLVMVAARITAAPFHVLIFHGPIAERTRIEQGIEKGVFIAGELQDSRSNLEKAICLNEGQEKLVEEDQGEIEEKSKLLSSSIEELEQNIEDLKYNPYKDKQREFSRPLEEKPGQKVWTMKDGLDWAKSERCTNDYMDKKKTYGGLSYAEAKVKCKSLVITRQERVDFLNKKIADIQGVINKKKKDAAGLVVEGEKADATRSELVKLNDECKKEVGKMENWYADGLKGYSRKLTSTSTESSVFTLTNCYNTSDVLKSCGTYRDGLKETSLEQKVSEYLDAKLKKQLEALDVEKQAQMATAPANSESLKNAFDAQKKAITALNEKKKQICSDWCFEYKPPNITKQILALDHMRFGEAPKWPEYQNYSLKDCQIMIDVLRIPVPDDGRCSAYASDVDLVEVTAQGAFINAVNIVNNDSKEGVVNTIGDELECSVRLKQGKEDTLYEIRWVINGAPKGNMGIFSKKTRPSATLDTSKGLYKGDSVSCQVTPLNQLGEIAKPVKSSTITMNKGPARPHVKETSADAKALDEQYFLVMVIGMFIPLVSLLFKMVAPKDLKNYYSVEYQDADTSKTLRKIMSPRDYGGDDWDADGDEADWGDDWGDDWEGLTDSDYSNLFEGEHPDVGIARDREARRQQKRQDQRQGQRQGRNQTPRNNEHAATNRADSRQQRTGTERVAQNRRRSTRKNNSRMR